MPRLYKKNEGNTQGTGRCSSDPPESECMACNQGFAGNPGDPGEVKGMLKSKSSFTTRPDAFFSWKSDDPIVVMKRSNVRGAKGVTEIEPQQRNFTEDIEPEMWRTQ
jgi:hypothetical protein